MSRRGQRARVTERSAIKVNARHRDLMFDELDAQNLRAQPASPKSSRTEVYGSHKRPQRLRPRFYPSRNKSAPYDDARSSIYPPATVTAAAYMNAWWYRQHHMSVDVAETSRSILLTRARAEGRSVEHVFPHETGQLGRVKEPERTQLHTGVFVPTASGSCGWVRSAYVQPSSLLRPHLTRLCSALPVMTRLAPYPFAALLDNAPTDTEDNALLRTIADTSTDTRLSELARDVIVPAAVLATPRFSPELHATHIDVFTAPPTTEREGTRERPLLHSSAFTHTCASLARTVDALASLAAQRQAVVCRQVHVLPCKGSERGGEPTRDARAAPDIAHVRLRLRPSGGAQTRSTLQRSLSAVTRQECAYEGGVVVSESAGLRCVRDATGAVRVQYNKASAPPRGEKRCASEASEPAPAAEEAEVSEFEEDEQEKETLHEADAPGRVADPAVVALSQLAVELATAAPSSKVETGAEIRDPDAEEEAVELSSLLDDVLDAEEDEGGGREDVKLMPGEIVWLSALPSAQLPYVPRALLSEGSATNALYSLAQWASQLCCPLHPGNMPRADRPLSDTACACGVSAGPTACEYPGLSELPLLSNHLWTQPRPRELLEPLSSGLFAAHEPTLNRLYDLIAQHPELDAFACEDNVPVPSLLAPLECVVAAVGADGVEVEVRMPRSLATQWWGRHDNDQVVAAASHRPTLAALAALAQEHVDTPLSLVDPWSPSANALGAVLTMVKHHLVASTQYPLRAHRNQSWIIVRGPSRLLPGRAIAAVASLTEPLLRIPAGNPAPAPPAGITSLLLRPVFALWDPRARARVLARVLHLGPWLTGVNALTADDPLNSLLSEALANDPDATDHSDGTALELRWERVLALALHPTVFAVVSARLRAEEVQALLEPAVLAKPLYGTAKHLATASSPARISYAAAERAMVLRLRALEFADDDDKEAEEERELEAGFTHGNDTGEEEDAPDADVAPHPTHPSHEANACPAESVADTSAPARACVCNDYLLPSRPSVLGPFTTHRALATAHWPCTQSSTQRNPGAGVWGGFQGFSGSTDSAATLASSFGEAPPPGTGLTCRLTTAVLAATGKPTSRAMQLLKQAAERYLRDAAAILTHPQDTRLSAASPLPLLAARVTRHSGHLSRRLEQLLELCSSLSLLPALPARSFSGDPSAPSDPSDPAAHGPVSPPRGHDRRRPVHHRHDDVAAQPEQSTLLLTPPFPTSTDTAAHPQDNLCPLPLHELDAAASILARVPLLNASQRHAIMSVLQRSISIIQGPPGTGKTQTTSFLVWLWVCALGDDLPLPDVNLPARTTLLRALAEVPPCIDSHLLPPAMADSASDDGHPFSFEDFSPLASFPACADAQLHHDIAPVPVSVPDTLSAASAPMAPLEMPSVPLAPSEMPAATPAAQLLEHRLALLEDLARARRSPCFSAPYAALVPARVSGRGPVLVCSFSNVAVDQITERLLALPGFSLASDRTLHPNRDGVHYSVVRVGKPHAMAPALQLASLDARAERHPHFAQHLAQARGLTDKYERALTAASRVRAALMQQTANLNLGCGGRGTTPGTNITARRRKGDEVRFTRAHTQRLAEAVRTGVPASAPMVARERSVAAAECAVDLTSVLALHEDIATLGLPLPTSCSVVRAGALVDSLSVLVKQLTSKRAQAQRAIAPILQRAREEVLRSASVVCTTCMAAGSALLRDLEFSLVIVDEASQVPETAALVPLMRLAKGGVGVGAGAGLAAEGPESAAVQTTTWVEVLRGRAQLVTGPTMSPLSLSRAVLVGDQCQLPPVTPDEWSKLGGKHRSLFARLLEEGVHSLSPLHALMPLNCAPESGEPLSAHVFSPHMLRVQYRMHPAIARWSARVLYGGNVVNGVSCCLRAPPARVPWTVGTRDSAVSYRLARCPILFLDMRCPERGAASGAGAEAYCGMRSGSKSNIGEARAVALVTASLLGLLRPLAPAHDATSSVSPRPLLPAEVGIVSGYVGQVRLITSQLQHYQKQLRAGVRHFPELLADIASYLPDTATRAHATYIPALTPLTPQTEDAEVAAAPATAAVPVLAQLSAVEVKSVDGFQGREKEVIVMSCVRSNLRATLGFLRDVRRMNVALTRARRGLVLVGNSACLARDGKWRGFIASLRAMGAVVPWEAVAPGLARAETLPATQFDL